MGYVSYYTCDVCTAKIPDEKAADDGRVSIQGGGFSIILCEGCQKTTTVFDAKARVRKLVADQAAALKTA